MITGKKILITRSFSTSSPALSTSSTAQYKRGEGEHFETKVLKKHLDTYTNLSIETVCAGPAMRARRGGLCGELNGLDFLVDFILSEAEVFLHQGRKVSSKK